MAYSGPLAEAQAFGDAPTAGDDAVVARMLERLGLDWSDRELATYRQTARLLVERERRSIELLAEALLCHGHLTGEQIGTMLPLGVGIAPILSARVDQLIY
jgi:hypothetical protein